MDKSKLIDKWLEQNHALIFNNVEIYLKTGYVKGAFKQLLIEMLQEFESEVRGEKTQLKNGKLPISHVRLSLPSTKEIREAREAYNKRAIAGHFDGDEPCKHFHAGIEWMLSRIVDGNEA